MCNEHERPRAMGALKDGPGMGTSAAADIEKAQQALQLNRYDCSPRNPPCR